MTKYEGDVWGSTPADYPAAQAQATYRKLLDAIPLPSFPRELMGYGFKGAAYRFRAMTEYQASFEGSISSRGGSAPPADEEFGQERSLFGFFVSGLSSLESLSFGVHAIAAHYSPTGFGCDESDLRGATPKSVGVALTSAWPKAAITKELEDLIQDDTYLTWKEIRNVLSHRMVPPRLILLSSHGPTKSLWHFTKAKLADADETLQGVTAGRRRWLADKVSRMWDAIDASFPAPRSP